MKLIIAAPLRRSVKVHKRISIDLERPFRVSRVFYRGGLEAAEGGGEGLEVLRLPEEEGVAGDEEGVGVVLEGGWGGGGEG